MNENDQVCLLRLQRSPGRPKLRATVKNVHTGTVHHFAGTQAMLLYLLDRMDGDLTLPEADQDSNMKQLKR